MGKSDMVNWFVKINKINWEPSDWGQSDMGN